MSNDSIHDNNNQWLGKSVEYPSVYNPSLLRGIARGNHRQTLGLSDPESLPFHGVDFVNAYEFSWLSLSGKPVSAILEIVLPVNTPNIIESKSLKLYLGSYNHTPFKDNNDVIRTLESDLSVTAKAPVMAQLHTIDQRERFIPFSFKGVCLDELEVDINEYQKNPELLKCLEGAEPAEKKEALSTHLFRSLCPVTSQPDWATVIVRYQGPAICHEGLLKYLISYREHTGFHEHCVESIFIDIMNRCQPTALTVHAHYTRRGGIDINPFRSNFEAADGNNSRTLRQ